MLLCYLHATAAVPRIVSKLQSCCSQVVGCAVRQGSSRVTLAHVPAALRCGQCLQQTYSRFTTLAGLTHRQVECSMHSMLLEKKKQKDCCSCRCDSFVG